MTKEQFTKRIGLIQNFHSEQETLGVLIDKLTDGRSIITFGDYLISELIDMVNEDMNIDDDDLLYWWLYEDVDKVMYDTKNNNKEIDIRTVEKLYDHIVENY